MKRNKSKTLCLLTAAFLLTALVPVSGVDKTPQEKDLEYFVGEWVSEYEYPGFGQVREESKYWWGDNKHEVKFEVKVTSAGNLVDTATGYIKIDQEKGILVTESSSPAGGTYKSWETKREGNTTYYDGESPGNPMMTSYKVTITTRTVDEMDLSIFMPEGDEFKKFLTVVYQRVKK